MEVIGGVMRLTRPLATLGTPESVREVVSERLSRLASPTGVLLDLAATAGPEFELDIVRRGTGLDDAELRCALDEAVRSGFIEELPERQLDYRFTHELVRRAVYDRLTGVRRAELHLRVGDALEAVEGRSVRALVDLAHHFTIAAPLGEADRAIEYNVLAARAALDALAFDQAAELLGTALELGIDDPAQRAEVLIELGGSTATGGQGARRVGRSAFGRRPRARAGKRGPPRSRRDRLRSRVLGPDDHRPRRGRTAGGGRGGAR